MGNFHATAADQSLPNEVLCLIMDILAPNEQCRMSLANKALRQHFVSTGLLLALDKALAARDAVNTQLMSDTWQWGIAVRRQPIRPDSFRKDFDKLYGHVSICTAFKSIYRFSLVMNDKVQCPAESSAESRCKNIEACRCLVQPCWHSALQRLGPYRPLAITSEQHKLERRQQLGSTIRGLQFVQEEWIAV